MEWQHGTWTMTEGQRLFWCVDGDEIMVTLEGSGAPDRDFWLSERQAENMIAGLSYQLNLLREARGRATSA